MQKLKTFMVIKTYLLSNRFDVFIFKIHWFKGLCLYIMSKQFMVMFIFVLIGKMYTIGVAMQMNIFEIFQIEDKGFWLRKRDDLR